MLAHRAPHERGQGLCSAGGADAECSWPSSGVTLAGRILPRRHRLGPLGNRTCPDLIVRGFLPVGVGECCALRSGACPCAGALLLAVVQGAERLAPWLRSPDGVAMWTLARSWSLTGRHLGFDMLHTAKRGAHHTASRVPPLARPGPGGRLCEYGAPRHTARARHNQRCRALRGAEGEEVGGCLVRRAVQFRTDRQSRQRKRRATLLPSPTASPT